MKKFILVDNQGNTSDHQHIETGKFHTGSSDAVDKSVEAIMNSGVYSPILAVLNYPGAIDAGLKMFLLNVWNIEGEGYSVVKEVEMPEITSEHKLSFAIKAVGAIYDFSAYKKWAYEWTTGVDRSVESLNAIQKVVDEEIAELKNIREVSYSMGLDLDEKDGVKMALFERAKVVFHAAEVALSTRSAQDFNQDITQVFNGIEEFVDTESLANMSDEILMVA